MGLFTQVFTRARALFVGLFSPRRKETVKKSWYIFSRNKLHIIGLAGVVLVLFITFFGAYIVPYPEHIGYFIDLKNTVSPPSWAHLFGTDDMGRDVLTRTLVAFRYSMTLAVVVLALAAPLGSVLGLIAGYTKGNWIEKLIMRVTDIFLGVPPLVLALAICSVLSPSLINSMFAVSLMWWPWYCRMAYSLSSSLKNEFFVQAAEVGGDSTFHILFREILPNCLPSILTKATLDVGFVILIAAMLSFVGLGAQPPTPDLGTMVSDGAKFLPEDWWISVIPGIVIALIITCFNLFGDGMRDVLVTETA